MREVELGPKFDAFATRWWDPDGPMAPLHWIHPVRLEYVAGRIRRHFGCRADAAEPLRGKRVLDVGCGGGLLSEALARLGGEVTGIDLAGRVLQVARLHAESCRLNITYMQRSVAQVVADGGRFDVVAALEVVEHIAPREHAAFFASLAELLSDSGILFLSTLHRNCKSFLLGIVAAERVLGWLPRGTHRWSYFLRPEESLEHLVRVGLRGTDVRGIVYVPILDKWKLSRRVGVNYILCASRT